MTPKVVVPPKHTCGPKVAWPEPAEPPALAARGHRHRPIEGERDAVYVTAPCPQDVRGEWAEASGRGCPERCRAPGMHQVVDTCRCGARRIFCPLWGHRWEAQRDE